MILRPRQREFVTRCVGALKTHGNTLGVAPTGAGKTICLSGTAGEFLAHPDAKACVLAHRDELTAQNQSKFSRVNPGISTSVFDARQKSWDGQATFAMVQTLARNLDQLPTLDLLIIDEAHHSAAPTYRQVIDTTLARNPHALIYGVTATPNRGDGKGLREVFSNVADQIRLGELIRSGHLVSPRTFVIDVGTRDALGGVRKLAEDYDMNAVATIMNTSPVNAAVVRHWKEHASGRKTIAFGATVAHAQAVCNAFLAEGVSAAVVHGDMSETERKATLAEFEAGHLTVIVNVAVLTEGYDYTPTSCIILLRPSSYKSTLIQMVGRGLRVVDPAEHPSVIKTDCVVLDFGTASLVHGSLEQENPDAERDSLRAELLGRLEGVLLTLYPAGKVRKNNFFVGDLLGSPGDSLEVVLTGDKAGLWTDRATGEGGDIFDLIAGCFALNVHCDFPRVLQAVRDVLGRAPTAPPTKRKRTALIDDLGPATAKWDYLAADGSLIACVYRYDPPGRKKEFRPWDARRGMQTPPNPRPLYNQPGLAQAPTVIVVEGEKCAKALIDAGICATTAMHGANAPVDKTDWSPLRGKHVLFWPDRDKPGWEYALSAADASLLAGALSCAVLFPPDGKAEGWDAADALSEGFEVQEFLSSAARITVQPPAAEEPDIPGENAVWATDDALALSFTRRYGEDWRYCAQWGKWLVWTGNRWQTDDTLLVTHLMRHICREAAIKADSHRLAAKLSASSTVSGVDRLARSDRQHASSSDEWDRDPWLANAPGGVIDLRTGQVRAHNRADRMTKIATATPKGDCPRWLAFLADITEGDQDLISYLQRVIGYCLTGVTSEHALFFLYGTGANGKSVFVNVITTILGDYAANAPMDTFMETRSDRHPTDLAGLRGARFVSSVETEQGRRWNESKVKAITGGDKVSARFMRQDFFEYLPQFKLIIAGNHKPSIRNVDEAMKRRLHLIPFTVTVPPEKRDGKLTEKLLKERDGILAWAVEGCRLWQQHGLKPPKVVIDATEEYFEEEDAIGEFLDEECQRHRQAKESVADIFQRWQEWANRRGEYIGTSRWLMQQLFNRGLERTRLHGGVKGLAGVSLKPKDYGERLPYRDD